MLTLMKINFHSQKDSPNYYGMNGELAHMAYYDHVLPESTILEHYNLLRCDVRPPYSSKVLDLAPLLVRRYTTVLDVENTFTDK